MKRNNRKSSKLKVLAVKLSKMIKELEKLSESQERDLAIRSLKSAKWNLLILSGIIEYLPPVTKTNLEAGLQALIENIGK